MARDRGIPGQIDQRLTPSYTFFNLGGLHLFAMRIGVSSIEFDIKPLI